MKDSKKIWEDIRPWYEDHYRVKFKRTPTDKEIIFLYENKKKFQECIDYHKQGGRTFVKTLAQRDFQPFTT